MRVVLASASPARLALLSRAGVRCDVVVSGVDEDSHHAESPAALVGALARAKGDAVAARVAVTEPTLVLAADTVLVLDGEVQGKPPSPAAARSRWRAQRGRRGDVLTAHHVTLVGTGPARTAAGLASTGVWFADVSDAEIDAYVATEEPLGAAGSFTIDGIGGAFVERIEGDHGTVVGLSLPLLRRLVAELGIEWPQLWSDGSPPGPGKG